MLLLRLPAITVVALAVVIATIPKVFYPNDDEAPFDLLRDVGQPQNGKKTFVITGANSGLGFGTTSHLATVPNTHIIMACRSMQRCLDAKAKITSHPTSALTCATLDLESRRSIKSFAGEVKTLLGNWTEAIDGLVNNAGFWAHGKDSDIFTSSGVELHMQVNHLGHVLLTHLLWPGMTKNGGARIVSVSSLTALLPFDSTAGWFSTTGRDNSSSFSVWIRPFFAFYAMARRYVRTKRANLEFAAELHDRYRDNVVSVASHPGYTRSNFMIKGLQHVPFWIRKAIKHNAFGSMNELDGAWTQVRPLLDDRIQGGVLVGPKYLTAGEAVPVCRLRDSGCTHCWPFSPEHSKQLWDQSMEALGIDDFGVV